MAGPLRSPNLVEAAAACALSAVLLLGLMVKEWPQLVPGDTSRDFPMLYVTAERARAGEPLYAPPDASLPGLLLNFNPPHFNALMIPFTAFPLGIAYFLWNGVSLALLFVVVRIAFNEVRGLVDRPATKWLIVAGVLGSAGVAATIRMGQISLWIALLVTLAWRAARESRWTPTAIWLGVAVSIKPFLLLGVPMLVVRGRLRAAILTIAVAAVALAAGGLWLGWPALADWLSVLQSPRRPASLAFNASVWGIAARATLPDAAPLAAAAVIGVITLWRARRTDEDTAWALCIAAALLCSPLGWVYYLPLLIGPVFTLASSGRLPRQAWWIAPAFLPPPLSPVILQEPVGVAVTLGSIYAWGLLALWIVFLHLRPSLPRNNVQNRGG